MKKLLLAGVLSIIGAASYAHDLGRGHDQGHGRVYDGHGHGHAHTLNHHIDGHTHYQGETFSSSSRIFCPNYIESRQAGSYVYYAQVDCHGRVITEWSTWSPQGPIIYYPRY